MGKSHRMNRREFVGGAAAAATALAFPLPAFAQSAARVVVIGGGFGGASAPGPKQTEPKMQVTLVEPDRLRRLPVQQNVIAGLRAIEAQQFGYDRSPRHGVTVAAQARPASIRRPDRQARQRHDAHYDRLVLSPGIDMRFGALRL